MSLARTKYGVEYNPRQLEKESNGLGWILAVVAVLTLVSLAVTLVGRYRDAERERKLAIEAEAAEKPVGPVEISSSASNVPSDETGKVSVVEATRFDKRPPKLQNLLLRLEEAEKARNVQMAATTIESIRALPGSPAADLDDALARRLGTLNVRRLLTMRSSEWVKKVEVRSGQSASRIASENGSTLASFRRLNGKVADRLVAGAVVYVMDHPRFNLVIHRRQLCADLSLNGKFFKRYDLKAAPKFKEGQYEWVEIGSRVDFKDREELDLLLPRSTSVLISEL